MITKIKIAFGIIIFLLLGVSNLNAYDIVNDDNSDQYRLYHGDYEMGQSLHVDLGSWCWPPDFAGPVGHGNSIDFLFRGHILGGSNLGCFWYGSPYPGVYNMKRYYKIGDINGNGKESDLNQGCFGTNCEWTLLEYDLGSNYGGKKYYLYQDLSNGGFESIELPFSKFFINGDYIFDVSSQGHIKVYKIVWNMLGTYHVLSSLIYDNLLSDSFQSPNMVSFPFIFGLNSNYYSNINYDFNYFVYGSDSNNFVGFDSVLNHFSNYGNLTSSGDILSILGQAYIYPYSITPNPQLFVRTGTGISLLYPKGVSFNGNSINNISWDCQYSSGTLCKDYNTFALGTFDDLTFMSGANLYFKNNDVVYRWNLNCLNPNYTSCKADLSGDYFCSNDYGTKDPQNIKCSDSMSLGSLSDYSGGSGSSNNSNSSGYSSDTYSYTGSNQNCNSVSFSGTSTFQTSENLDYRTCAWQTVNGNFACQDNNGHSCKISGDACLQIISNPTQYSSGSYLYSGDITKYNCNTQKYNCYWQNKDSCGPSEYCYSPDNIYCKIKPQYDDSKIIKNGQDISNSGFSIPTGPASGNGWDSFGNAVGNGGTGSISGGIGSGYNDVQKDLTNSGYCDMFSSGGTFVYYSNGPGFILNLNTAGYTNNKYIRDYLLIWIDKGINLILSPINNTFSILRIIGTIDNNTNVCFLGVITNVKYQSSLIDGQNRLHYPGEYNFVLGHMTPYDYIFLLLFGLLVLSYVSILFGFRGSIGSLGNSGEGFNFQDKKTVNDWGMQIKHK